MSRARKQTIHFDRRGGVLFYRGASGKTVDHIRLSQADHTILVVVAFTDDNRVVRHPQFHSGSGGLALCPR
jgi:hypothetical protein